MIAEVLAVVLSGLPVLFSGLFFVAASRLNSPRLSMLLIRPSGERCQARMSGQQGGWQKQRRYSLFEKQPAASLLKEAAGLCCRLGSAKVRLSTQTIEGSDPSSTSQWP